MDVIETIWDCGIWDQKYTYNVSIIQEFRNKALWFIVNAPQYVPTTVIGRDIKREPVSYTHLDVYKRQIKYIPNHIQTFSPAQHRKL